MMDKGNISWKELYTQAEISETSRDIDSLKSLLKIEDLRFLLMQITRLNKPESIQILSTYQTKQKQLGGWVDGLFPDQFIDENLVIPDNFPNKIKCMLQLAEQRKTNLDTIKSMGEYTLNFKDNELELDTSNNTYPDNWMLTIDYSVMEKTLNLLKDKPKRKEALKVANLEANQQMLKHRQNLGYLPGPITDTNDLTELLIWAASDKPIDLIWKWLNPLNIFELADVYNNHTNFKNLFEIIKNNESSLKRYILSTISQYIKDDLEFNETFALTFGFAIRGWATDDMFGVNIENIKYKYPKLISIIAHELLHRLQTRICTSEGNKKTFAELVSGNMEDEKDNKFYEILSYIMLEGTGEFIRHQFDAEKAKNLKENTIEGLALLKEVYRAIYMEKELEKADQMLNQGLKSNEVFYSLGEYITKGLIESNNKRYLGEILKEGVLAFFLEGKKADESLEYNDQILDKIKKLKEKK